MECLLPYLCIATVPHIMVGLERMLDYRGVGLTRFHCIDKDTVFLIKSKLHSIMPSKYHEGHTKSVRGTYVLTF